MQKTAAIMKTEPICIHRATFRNAVPVNLICSETVAVAEEYKLSYHNTTKYSNLKESYLEQSETHQRKKMMLWNLTELQLNKRGKITTSQQAAWVFSKHNKPYTGLDEAAVWSELIDIQATSDMKAALQRCSGSEWPRDLDSTIGYLKAWAPFGWLVPKSMIHVGHVCAHHVWLNIHLWSCVLKN